MAKQAIGSGWNWRQHRAMAGVAAIAAVFGVAASLLISGQERQPTQAPIITSGSASAGTGMTAQPAGFWAGQIRGRNQTPRVLPVSMSYSPQQSSQSYPQGQQAPAPIVRGNSKGNGDPASQNESLQYNTQPPLAGDQGNGTVAQTPQNGIGDPSLNATDDPNYVDAQNGAQEAAGYDALDQAQQADQAPPPLPEYDQPPAPDDDYLWTPGYWGFNTGYYWVPGAWVAPPFYGALWTPPWWGFYGNRYFFHRGFWGTHIGYYGGINYGYGYVGSGYYGGYWQGHNFYYNRSVSNVNVSRVRYVYDRPVVINNVVHTGRSLNRTSFNGGSGGVHFQPRPYELAAMREAHYAPVPAQVQSHRMAAADRGQFFSRNHGQPAEAFQQRPLSSPRAIADTPQRAPVNPQTYGEGSRSTFGAGRPGETRAGENRTGGQSGNAGASRPADNRTPANTASPAASEINHPSLDNGAGNPRNDMIRQRTGLWGGDRVRGLEAQQQPAGQTQARSDATQQQQRDFRQQNQQQVEAARQGQRDVQQGQQGYRNQVFEQQREARQQTQNQQGQQRLGIEQQQNQQIQLQQQQSQQQDRNIQVQQQRMATEQQRQAEQQQQGQGQQQQRQAYEQQRQVQQQQRQAFEQQRQVQQQQQRPQVGPQRIEARPAPQAGGQGPGGAHERPH